MLNRWLLTLEIELEQGQSLAELALALEGLASKAKGVSYALAVGTQLVSRDPVAAVTTRSDI